MKSTLQVWLLVSLYALIRQDGQVFAQSCDERRQVSSGSTGTISSPNYPQAYPPHSRCTYRIGSASASGHVTLTFNAFAVEAHRSCAFDYLAIYDGPTTSSSLLGKFCGSKLPQALSSTGQYLTIEFRSDESMAGDGFSFQYSVGCTYIFNNQQGEFTTPGYPTNYPDSSECQYNIQPTGGSQILLKFTSFELEDSNDCEFDRATIKTDPGSTKEIARYCGNHEAFSKLVNSSRLSVGFYSDRSVSRAGFRVQYKVTTDCNNDNGGCSDTCTVVQPGKVLCSCDTGYKLDSSSVKCIDINECEDSPCQDVCENTDGSYTCSCSTPGFQLSPNGKSCTDMTCKTNNGGCEHTCQPFGNAQYHCACHRGFILSPDMHNCSDINECTTTNSQYVHKCEQNCFNEAGSYYCDCNEGYQLSPNGRTCDVFKNCTPSSGICGGPPPCCVTDIDECLEHSHVCDHRCINVPSGWQCACYEGYNVDPENENGCVDIDECEENLYPDTCKTCLNVESTYECFCKDGFSPNDDNTNCTDNDECADGSNGGCGQICINKPGTFKCECENGYTLTSNTSSSCNDINECTPNNGRGPCNHYCENMPGSFQCACNGGYRLMESGLVCKDIDECEEKDNGNCQQQCINTPGSFNCECFVGYVDNNGTCIDVNECSEIPCDQSVQSSCTNSPGSFICECPPGYVVVNVTTCQDVNECDKSDHGCPQDCFNTPGSYECRCFDGYAKTADKQCSDINECSQNPCQQTCVNLVGSFRCDCDLGYYLLGNGQNCSDVNECTDAIHKCDQICVNELGHYRCECEDGYILDNNNQSCSDIDECASDTSGCSDRCINTQGSFWCYCDNGFELSADNKTCQDTNECAVNNGGCEHACTNTNGSYTCGCNDGYMFNGTHGCSDVDECATNNGNCSQTCANLPGTYECQCGPTFKLGIDGRTCEHCPSCEDYQLLAQDVASMKQLAATVQQLRDINLGLSAKVASLESRLELLENGGEQLPPRK